MKIGYANVSVSDFDRAVDFYSNALGLALNFKDDNFGYASFAAGDISLAVVRTEDATMVGRHTGIGFIVDDIDARYEELVAKGVEFEMPRLRSSPGVEL